MHGKPGGDAEEIVRMQRWWGKGWATARSGSPPVLSISLGRTRTRRKLSHWRRLRLRTVERTPSHMRDEGEHLLDAINEAATVGKETGMPVELSHFKVVSPRLWGMSDMSLALVEKYRREGVDVVVDQYPYDRSSTNLGITLPTRASSASGQEKIRQRRTEPATRDKVAREMAGMLRGLGHPDYSYATVASFGPDRAYEGKTISEINVMKARPANTASEIETILDMVLQGGAQMVYHSMGDEICNASCDTRIPPASDGGVRDSGPAFRTRVPTERTLVSCRNTCAIAGSSRSRMDTPYDIPAGADVPFAGPRSDSRRSGGRPRPVQSCACSRQGDISAAASILRGVRKLRDRERKDRGGGWQDYGRAGRDSLAQSIAT